MRVLAVGAHPDDIELGCGGTLAAHRRAGHDITLLVMSSPGLSREERESEQEEAAGVLGAALVWGGFADGSVPSGRPSVALIDDVLRQCQADVVYTHSVNDTHQDHRATATATLGAARHCSRVLAYESPTSTCFNPTVFVDIDHFVEDKLSLVRAHMSQVLRNGLVDLEAIEAQARFRGFQGRIRNAEGFEVARFLLDIQSATESVGEAEIIDLVEREAPL